MGLTTFSSNRPIKRETTIAKNYMNEKELFALRRMVSAFFDMAELKASMQEAMYMKDWLKMLDTFSASFGVGVLTNSGTISTQQATEKAHKEYAKYTNIIADEFSEVEKVYLQTLKDMQQRLENKK